MTDQEWMDFRRDYLMRHNAYLADTPEIRAQFDSDFGQAEIVPVPVREDRSDVFDVPPNPADFPIGIEVHLDQTHSDSDPIEVQGYEGREIARAIAVDPEPELAVDPRQKMIEAMRRRQGTG